MKPVILSSALLLLSLRAFAQGTPPAADAEGFKPIVVTNQAGEIPEVVTIEAKGQPLIKVSMADSPKNTRIVILPSALNKGTTCTLQKGVTTIKGTFSALLSQDGKGLWDMIVFDGILTVKPIAPVQAPTPPSTPQTH